MIFRFECTVEKLTEACQDELEDIFSNLIDADRSGRHFFVLERKLCDWVIENIELSRLNREHLKLVREEYSYRGSFFKVPCAYVNVTIGNEPVTFDGNDIFSIGHQPLIQGKFLLNESYLIVENSESDGELYKQIFREMIKVTKVPINLDLLRGGGSTTNREFKSRIAEQKIVVCIVDHDKLAPMDKTSDTAKKVEKIYKERNLNNRNQCFIGLGILTIGRELENYIPYHLFKKIYSSYEHFDKLDKLFSQIKCTTPEDCFWLYFDIKKGIKGLELKDNENISVNVRNWICDRVECNYDAIDQICIPGFGGRTVNVLLANKEALGDFHKFVRSDYWQSMFGSYFERLLWYFAAPTRVRT